MEKLKSLENQRLVSQLSYKQNDYEYRQELMAQVDVQFQDNILKVLEEYPSIGDMYNAKLKETEKNISQIINENRPQNVESKEMEDGDIEAGQVDEESTTISEEITIPEDTRAPRIKRLYREIAKVTHPDKIKSDKLNSFYVDATNFYNNSDYVELLLVGHKVGISIDLEDEDISEIIDKIKFYEDRMKLMESTYTWVWYSTEDDQQKKNILLGYIKSRIL